MKKICFHLFLIVLFPIGLLAQNVGIGTTTPDNTAVLDITSSSKGVLIPRLTTAQRDAMVSPANGLMIYNSSSKEYNFYNGVRWQNINSVPKGGIIFGNNYLDSTILMQGYQYEGFITQDFKKQVIRDTTIPANNWYLGNRADYQNEMAPGGGIAGFNGTDLFVFTNDTIYVYNQASDRWTHRPITNVSGDLLLDIIINGTIVWTGAEFLLWGGGNRITSSFPCGIGHICHNYSPLTNRGFRYKPATDTWDTISLASSPQARYQHKAIWTGNEMIVWGGKSNTIDSAHYYLSTGAKYNPLTNTWTSLPVSVGFEAREKFVMTMAGSNKFIIWGGRSTENKTRTITSPCSPFNQVSFQYDSARNYSNGRVYNLDNDSWTEMSTVNAPMGRFNTTGQMDFSSLIIAGGRFTKITGFYCGTCFTDNIFPIPYACVKVNASDSILKTGGRYDVISNTWTTIPDSPKSFSECVAFWDTEQFISYFGKDSIISFEPSAGDWYQTLLPPLLPFDNLSQREVVWSTGSLAGLNNFIVLPPGIPNFGRQAVYNYKFTPTTLPEIVSTSMEAGKRLYLYKKD